MVSNNYSNENLSLLTKKLLFFRIFLYSCFGILIVISGLFLGFANYENRILFSVIGSFSVAIVSSIICFFLFRLSEIKDIIFQFKQIQENKSIDIIAKVIGFSKKEFTLSDNCQVYEIRISRDEKEYIYYLSSLFEPNFIIGKTYKFEMVSEFIREWRYEG